MKKKILILRHEDEGFIQSEKAFCDHCGKEAQKLSWGVDGYEDLCISCRDELAYTEEEKKEREKDAPANMKILPYLEWGKDAYKPKPKWAR